MLDNTEMGCQPRLWAECVPWGLWAVLGGQVSPLPSSDSLVATEKTHSILQACSRINSGGKANLIFFFFHCLENLSKRWEVLSCCPLPCGLAHEPSSGCVHCDPALVAAGGSACALGSGQGSCPRRRCLQTDLRGMGLCGPRSPECCSQP